MAACVSATSASRLNPYAPFFVPAAFSAVEDFSSEWWNFIQSCPAFREYWLAERFDPPEIELASDFDAHDLLDLEPEFVNIEQEMPSSGMDLKDFARLAGWRPEETAVKLARRPFSSFPHQPKPLKVTQPQKPGMRKIQQPR